MAWGYPLGCGSPLKFPARGAGPRVNSKVVHGVHGAPRFCFVTFCTSPWGVPTLQSEHMVGPERKQKTNQTEECGLNSERWGETGFVTGKEDLGSRHTLRSNIWSVSFPAIFWCLWRLLCWEQGAHFSWICVPSSRSDVGQRKGSKKIQTSTNAGDSVNSKTPRLGRGASPGRPISFCFLCSLAL